MLPSPGDIFAGRYRIDHRIGEGGYSAVFAATLPEAGRRVAIKILAPRDDAHPRKHIGRFRREAKLLSDLRDPHTIMLHDYGESRDGLLYMIFEYVDGRTLSDIIKRDGALEAHRVLHVLKQILYSLREAHSAGILHRDIKPGNIMLYDCMDDTDQVKVIDFGIAKPFSEDGEVSGRLTGTGNIVGTPRYMAPEQIRCERVSAATDLYSLGLVAYEMLVGGRAVDTNDELSLFESHLSEESMQLPETVDIPDRLRDVINRMMRREPESRYVSCEAALEDLEEVEFDFDPVRLREGQDAPDEDEHDDERIRLPHVLLAAGLFVISAVFVYTVISFLR